MRSFVTVARIRSGLMMLGVLLLAACGRQPPTRAAGADTSTVIVDVRTPQEFAERHVRGAILIPYDQMGQRWRELERYRNRPMIVYCRTGRRAAVALDVLKANGFTHAVNGGGLADVMARGASTESGDAKSR